jgi:hypothetical protein
MSDELYPIKNIHIGMRYTSFFNDHETIFEHNSICDKRGYVWFGKFGMGISKSMSDKILNQIKSNLPTYLFLCEGNNYTYYAKIIELVSLGGNKRADSPEKSHTPEYYQNTKCSLWMKIEKLISINPSLVPSLKFYSDITKSATKMGMRGLIYITIFK